MHPINSRDTQQAVRRKVGENGTRRKSWKWNRFSHGLRVVNVLCVIIFIYTHIEANKNSKEPEKIGLGQNETQLCPCRVGIVNLNKQQRRLTEGM